MSGSKGKTPVTRARTEAEVIPAPVAAAVADGDGEADGEGSDAGDAFEDVGFLEDSNALLDKIQTTAENVTTCQNQIEELFYRLGLLILALKQDSKTWSGDKIQQTAAQIEDLMKRCHRQMQRFAIYGRVKAFVNRKELSAWIESFMLEINRAYKSFSTSSHEDLEEAEWVPAFAQAKEGDRKAAWEQSREIALYEADVKMILGMGRDAIENLTKTLNKSVEEMGYSKHRGFTETYHARLTTLIETRLENPEDYAGDSGAARAKREEAEWEFVVNGGEGMGETEDEYNPPPRWEPWAAPGRSVASGTGVGIGVGVVRGGVGGDYANVPPPGEAPPSYF